jgi:hypothetical protein
MQRQRFYNLSCLPGAGKAARHECLTASLSGLSRYREKRLSPMPGSEEDKLIVMKKQVEYLQRLFYDIWNDFGSVYLVVKDSGRTSIGKRGFTEEEHKQGLILVFNDKTSAALDWDPEGNLSCVLAFGIRREDVYIHHEDLLAVYSPEAKVQFLRSDMGEEPAAAPATDAGRSDARQVVSIKNFKKRKSGQQP